MKPDSSIHATTAGSQSSPPEYQSQVTLNDNADFSLPDYTSQVYNPSEVVSSANRQKGFFRSSRSKIKKFWDKTEIGKSSGFDNTTQHFFQPNTSPATH
jgi:hypothetical protein